MRIIVRSTDQYFENEESIVLNCDLDEEPKEDYGHWLGDLDDFKNDHNADIDEINKIHGKIKDNIVYKKVT